MAEKRPHPNDDHDVNGGSKRVRSNHGSPAPPSSGAGTPAQSADIQKDIIEQARARAKAVRDRLSAPKPGTAAPAQSPAEAARARIEAMKARVAAATARANAPSQQQQAVPVPVFPPSDVDDGFSRARGGLNIGIHPALMGESGQDARSKGKQALQPKFATTMANRRTESPAERAGKDKKQLDLSGPSLEELKKNPLFDANLGGQGGMARSRHSRQLIFHQKGKFIQQANALRRQAALEAMKKRIADQARKVGLDEDNEKAFLVPAPPDIEWWDEGLLSDKSYDCLEKPDGIKVDTPDSIITIYIQHPVLLEPPQDKNAPAPKPMYLTKTEQAKLRRQRRMADHKEQQAKIRLGLEPPPPPKVKKSNLMRVLGEQAVKDPTAVEARVNREIAERAAAHQAANEERKLTKEQRAQKLAANQDADAAKGIKVAVFKIDSLAFGKHRYQVDINAKQHSLTGVCILHPRFNLVIVEGGAHGIHHYTKLMLNRIKWTEVSAPSSIHENGRREPEADWLKPVDEKGELKDFGQNKCTLIWEGEEKARAFRKWSSRVCETDAEAKEALTRSKMENFWTLAKSMP